jgi:hypothetical protein
MRLCFSVLMMAVAMGSACVYADPTPSPSPQAIVVPNPQTPSNAATVVQVAEPAAPPTWAQEVMVTAQKLPLVGPILTKAVLYLGILSSLLTSFVAFVLGALKLVSTVSNLAGIAGFADKVVAFQNGKFMYWLKFFSMFNAKKSSADATAKPA